MPDHTAVTPNAINIVKFTMGFKIALTGSIVMKKKK